MNTASAAHTGEPPKEDPSCYAIDSVDLGKRYRKHWALRDCSLRIPRGKICALTGPNGAGKSTLMQVVMGLTPPTTGSLRVLGRVPDARGAPAGVSFLAQEKPLYRGLRVDEMLRAAAALNQSRSSGSSTPMSNWDAAYAQRLVNEARLPLDTRVGSLSGGQRTRLALALALGRRPELLVLDEPFADLDPSARRKVMATLLGEVTDTKMTVLLSSHVIADLESVCDYLVLLRDGRVQLAGQVTELLEAHHIVSGPDPLPDSIRGTATELIELTISGHQAVAPINGPTPDGTDGLSLRRPSLEDLVVAYLDAPDHSNQKSAGVIR